MSIQDGNYKSEHKTERNPLLLACSGGGGHISAIQGIRDFLRLKYPRETHFSNYPPVLYTQKKSSWTTKSIFLGSILTNHIYILSPIIKKILHFTPFPVLPNLNELKNEILTLNKKETNNISRDYIDMLLDIYPAGYESAAVWNILQRQDQTTELKKLITLQRMNDQNNYSFVYPEMFNVLTHAAINHKPYTEIICTQAMGLPALCDAVIQYNDCHQDKPQLIIHQYMTDLPTQGAVHFFNALSRLTAKQQQQIKLYGVGMTQKVMDYFFPNGYFFNGVHNIPSKNNPMVRAGFKDPQYDNSNKFNLHVTLAMHEEEPLIIKPNERISSIILGSQASLDTVEYIETLIKIGMDKVFVFSGKIDAISKKIDAIIVNHPTYREKIIRLGYQDGHHLAQLMTRSNIIITRGGGLSVMEQMAMLHNTQQIILIHHRNADTRELTSGISWEDDNVNVLISDLKLNQVHAVKTSPARAMRQMNETTLLSPHA